MTCKKRRIELHKGYVTSQYSKSIDEGRGKKNTNKLNNGPSLLVYLNIQTNQQRLRIKTPFFRKKKLVRKKTNHNKSKKKLEID
jgi:hypothetical protein